MDSRRLVDMLCVLVYRLSLDILQYICEGRWLGLQNGVLLMAVMRVGAEMPIMRGVIPAPYQFPALGLPMEGIATLFVVDIFSGV